MQIVELLELAICLVETSFKPETHAGTRAFLLETPNDSSPSMFRPKPHSNALFSIICRPMRYVSSADWPTLRVVEPVLAELLGGTIEALTVSDGVTGIELLAYAYV